MRCLNRVKSSLAGIALLSVLSFGAEVSVDKFSENLLFSGRWEHGKEYSRTSAPAAMVQFNAQAKSLEFELEGEARFRVDEDGKQIADVPNAFIAADNIEYTLGNKIPLWLFGFLY
jgi:hypothetical protein